MNPATTSPERAAQITARLAALGVREADLEETFVRAAGPGGQNVNKTATCVVLRHRPTGVQVRCQATRQQGLNRLLAREWLAARLAALARARAAAERAQREKARRQQRRPSAAARRRMVEAKRRQAEKKAARRRVEPE
jgi:protein subunit release factor B